MAAPIRVIVVTVSDSRTLANDESGNVLATKLEEVGMKVQRHPPVRDDINVIRELVGAASTQNGADVIVLTGGTGISPTDVTPEAIEPLFEKRIDGFGEEFRRRSWVAPSPWRSNATPDQPSSVGGRAMLSRVTAGVVAGTIVVALPGSPAAAELGALLLVEILPHAVAVASGQVRTHSK